MTHQTKMAKQTKTRLRFSAEDDLCFLREVIGQNPFENPSKWDVITKNVIERSGKKFSNKTLKEHVEYMEKLFSAEDWANRKKSGTEEQYTEKESMLQEIKDLIKEFGCTTKKSHKEEAARQSVKVNKEVGLQLRDEAAANYFLQSVSYTSGHIENDNDVTVEVLPENNDQENDATSCTITLDEQQTNSSETTRAQTPLHLRKRRKTIVPDSALNYLRERNASELNIKKQQIAVEEKRLLLDERRIELDEKKFELEEKKLI